MNTIADHIRIAGTIIRFYILLFFLGVGCTERFELPHENSQQGVPEGMIRLTIAPNLAPSVAVATRSTVASSIDKDLSGAIRVLVFDTNVPTNAILTQKPASAAFEGGSAGDGKLKVLLNVDANERYLCVVANLSNVDVAYLSSLGGGESYSEIASKLRFPLPSSPPFYISAPLPMTGWSDATKLEVSANPTNLNKTVTFQRSVARVDINATSANFMVHGASMSSAPRYGYTLPQDVLPIFNIIDLSTHDLVPNGPAPTMEDHLFCFESKGNLDGVADRSTRVIIKGARQGASTPSYYPIDIIYPESLDPNAKILADIKRNTIYTINLKSVEKDGYRTVEEAARSEAFNTQLDMDIVVTDPFAHDITTNGKQYLGVTNSEFVLYPLNNSIAENIHITSLSYTCDPGWSVGSITLPSGMTLAGSGATVGRLDVSRSTVLHDIVANVAASFTSGAIIVHIGNLRKEIIVRRMTPTPSTGGVFDNYFEAPSVIKEYKVGEIIAPSAASDWLKVGATAENGIGASSLNNQVVNPEGGVYIHVEPNAGFNVTATTREASLYVAGEKDNQRIKVLVQQDFFDIYSGTNQIEPYSYVGTFHRWNETAERLIRIHAPAAELAGAGAQIADLWWQADVVSGRDFIVLDTISTHKDSGTTIWINNGTRVNEFGVGDTPLGLYTNSSDLENASGAQLDSKLRSVRKEGTESVYFRVGLTGRLAGPNAAPRYGLITISAGVKGKAASTKHNIYVRQGEAADYLMRPWDPSTARADGTFEFRSATRPMARKFAPYNLTHIGDHTFDYVNEGKNGYGFVDYPSQGGYYFRASGSYAINPTRAGSFNVPTDVVALPEFSIKENEGWKADWETCPRGYRRPRDGEGRRYLDNYGEGIKDPGGSNPYYKNDIIDSEARQSLWLYPLHGGFKSDFSNQIRGFLADGFFDRREITKTVNRSEYGIVERTSVKAAYRGYLVFNPINYASIFFPLAGSYDPNTNNFVHSKGDLMILQTATAGATSQDGWTIQSGFFGHGQTLPKWIFDLHYKQAASGGHTIRCIKDDQPLIGTEKGNTTIDAIDTSTPSLLAIRQAYNIAGGRTLQQEIETDYSTIDLRRRINSLSISGDKALTSDDYQFLNRWAEGTEYGTNANLHHLSIRGKGNVSIPSNAFTSDGWSHIQLFDAKVIQKDAFLGVKKLFNLSLIYIDGMTVDPEAFQFTTTSVQLHLHKSGVEYAASDKSMKQWKGKQWAVIKAE